MRNVKAWMGGLVGPVVIVSGITISQFAVYVQ